MNRILITVLALTATLFLLLQPGSDRGPERSVGQTPASEPALTAWQLLEPAEPAKERTAERHSALDRRIMLKTRFRPVPLPEVLHLPLPGGDLMSAEVETVHRHDNGDLSLLARNADGDSALLTFGPAGLFARIRSRERIVQVTTDDSGSWMLDLSGEGLEVDHFGHDVLHAADSLQVPGQSPAWHPPAGLDGHDGGDLTRIDVMLIHPPSLARRYPGTLLSTRFNHFIAIANQALIDSRVSAQVRLVHFEQTAYDRHQRNSDALQDLRTAAAGGNVPGLSGLASTRAQHAADIVAMIWPHDIETRGACGIAYFPQIQSGGQGRPEFGVHITNDGTSNWSVCSDAVFAHELGHNLGAQHQRSTVSSADPQAANFAWTQAGRWHTVMGSFGTGHVDRYLRLDVYSNPDVSCAGEPCGSTQSGNRADNAATMSELAPVVAAYSGSVGSTAEHPPVSDGDQDGDGIPDSEDPYPFDPYNGEEPPQEDPLVFWPRRLKEPDPDLEPNWELLVVSSGDDRVLSWGLDGRFRGLVTAPRADGPGPVLTEYSDLLADGAGRLYLLASEDVRRFDRLSGRQIDIFLDSAMPQPATLQSAFPRAMAWLDNGRLAVLGDTAIEVYDPEGRRLNPPGSGTPTSTPLTWRDPLDMPLRALAARNGRLWVAEGADNRILGFSTQNGMRGPDLAAAGPGSLLTDPRDMVVGPDGLLYVANGGANNVLRFDPEQDGHVDEFVASGRGGLDFARALAFGPQGELYVASRANNTILIYDRDGDWIGEITHDGNQGLAQPESLLVVPVLDQVGPGHSGHYFVPERGGEGWLLEILDEERAAISWFTYPPLDSDAGDQAWVVGVGAIDGSRIVFDEMLATRLADPTAPIETDNIEVLPWGSLTLDFSNCQHGRARYDSPLFGAGGELDFVRLIAIAGLPCGDLPRAPESGTPGISGQWSDPASSGQGWFLEELGEGRVFTAWFTYDDRGEQAWLVGEGQLDGNQLIFEQLTLTRGASFGPDFDAAAIEYLPWGQLEFTFEDCDLASASYASELPGFGQGELMPERLSSLAGLECGLGR